MYFIFQDLNIIFIGGLLSCFVGRCWMFMMHSNILNAIHLVAFKGYKELPVMLILVAPVNKSCVSTNRLLLDDIDLAILSICFGGDHIIIQFTILLHLLLHFAQCQTFWLSLVEIVSLSMTSHWSLVSYSICITVSHGAFLFDDSLTPFIMYKSAQCLFTLSPRPISLMLLWTRLKNNGLVALHSQSFPYNDYCFTEGLRRAYFSIATSK